MTRTQIVCVLAWLGTAMAAQNYDCALVGGAEPCVTACLNSHKQCDTIMSVTGINDQVACLNTALSCVECCLATVVSASSDTDARTQCTSNALQCAASTFITCANQEGNCEYDGIASAACCGTLGNITVTSCPPGTAINGCCSDAWHVIQNECRCGNTPNYLTSQSC
jgi:hypothetical protein